MASIEATGHPIATPEFRARTPAARRLWRTARSKPIGAVAGLICVLLVLIALFAEQLAPHAVDATTFPRQHAPSLTYPMGTDNLFRDMFSRIIVGSRI